MKTIERVRLSELKPNESNPRADFGDIAALADSIRSTGGEPVNPIVCVRDGGTLFIVDGERRYRALKEIYGEDDPEVSVTVVDGWREGNEVLAMLATDNKKRLSEVEMSRGYQLAFDLGNALNDTQIAMSTGAKTDDVMNARLAWNRLGRAERERYAQCSFDQLAAAQEFDGKEFEAVLRAKPESWRMKATNLRAEKVRRSYQDKAMDICATVGIEWVEAKEDGTSCYERLRTYWRMDDEKIAGLAADIADTGATVMLHFKSSWRGEYALAKPAEEHEEPEPDIAELERMRARGIHSDLRERLIAFLAIAPSTRALRRLAADRRSTYEIDRYKEMLVSGGMDPNAADALLGEPATMLELCKAVWSRSLYGNPTWASAWVGAAEADGFEPSEDERWLVGYVDRMLAEGDAR